MRSIWNGAISFGLVSIPIKVVNATENHNVSFRQIHTEDGGRIRYRKVCELEDKEVEQAEIGKGYEDADGSIIPITEEDLASLPIPTTKTIEIVSFVPEDRIDPLMMDTAYYLAANGAPAGKPYTLLREALKRSHKVAVAKFALRGRERLGMLRVVDDVIAMHGLLWPDEIRAPEGVAPEGNVTVRDAELDLADALMDTLGEVDLDELHDDYREAVEELIASKVDGAPLAPAPAPEKSGGKVIDLMSALQSSVRAAQEARTGKAAAGSGGSEEAADEMAEVTALSGSGRSRGGSGTGAARRKAAPASPKEVGGKKSTASGRGTKKAAAKKTAAGSKASTSKAASGSKTSSSKAKASTASGSRGAAKKTAAKSTAKKASSRRKAS